MADTTTDSLSNALDIVQRQQNEIAALKAELQALRLTTQLPASKPDSGTKHIFRFLELPRELRKAIYELCVVVGEVRIVRRGTLEEFDMRYNRPRAAKAEVQLFRVNKKVRREALDLYLSKNHLVLPAAAYMDSYSNAFQYIPGLRGFSHDLQLRSLSISLDGGTETSFAARKFDDRRCVNFHSKLSKSERPELPDALEYFHEKVTDQQYFHAFYLLDNLLSVQEPMRKLQINLENASCALGCHRFVKSLFEDLPDYLPASFARATRRFKCRFEALDFLGTVND